MDDKPAGAPPHDDDPVAEPESQHDSQGPETATAPEADPRTTIAGRYAIDLQDPPRGGGVAVSYRGRDLRSRDPVVVKTLRLEYRSDPEMRARFRREARLLQFLSHPNVIRALAFTEERGAPWLVLESVRGKSLRDEIAMGAPFSPEEVVPLLQGIAAGLDHLHARGLVHLDVRPENVIVTPDGGVKLVDFGIAQTAGMMQDTTDGVAPDNVAYLAPEQTCGEPVTAATDVYALGCVVYELLTGEPPFFSEDEPAARNAAIRARLEQAPLPPTIVRGDALPAWVDDVVLGALERDPRQRYGSAGSFAAVFHSGVEGDVDVETGRPRQPAAVQARQIPNNEPGIAMRGSPRRAARRGTPSGGPSESGAGVVDAAFAPRTASQPSPGTMHIAERSPGVDVERIGRWLWRAVILAALLNIALIAALVVTQGEIPGVWRGGSNIAPGVLVRVAGAGLVARAAPDPGAAIVGDLPDGGTVRISGEAVQGPDGLWWPVEVETGEALTAGFVPESWLRAQ